MAGPRHKEPFFACFNIDLSVMGKRFASVDELATAATSPFCFIASILQLLVDLKLWHSSDLTPVWTLSYLSVPLSLQ